MRRALAKTRGKARVAKPAGAPLVPIGAGWSAALVPTAGGALLRVGRGAGEPTLEIVVALTSEGPVLRARAAAMEIETDGDLIARCDRFRVEARQSVELISGGDLQARGRTVGIEATHGDARVHANDDVQLQGENVLLNCDRTPPTIPSWALAAPVPPAPSVAPAPASGDRALIDDLAGDGGVHRIEGTDGSAGGKDGG